MASMTLAQPDPAAASPSSRARPWSRHPVVPSVISALLFWMSFPPVGWWPLSFFALAFLFALIKSPRSRVSLYFGSWVGGFLFWLLAIQWVRLTDPSAWLAWVVMALFLSLWWPVFLCVSRVAVNGLKLPIMVAAPIVWVGLEYFRAHILTGFPWYYLAHSVYAVLPMIQIADFAGALGISLVIALVNAWWVEVVTLPLLRPTPSGPRLTRAQAWRGSIVLGVLLATLAYGAYRIGSADFRKGPVVALLQSNLEQHVKMAGDPHANVALYQSLIDEARSRNPSPDLIVWPETSYPYGFFSQINAKLTAAEFDEQAKALDQDPEKLREHIDLVTRHLHGWTDVINIPMLVGLTLHDFNPAGHSRFNSAVLFEPGVPTLQSYHKLHLVPFGEYVPLVDYLPWLTALTPYHGTKIPSLTFGREPLWLELGEYRIATAICFEDTVPHVVRRFFSEAPGGRQPDMLINMSNDGWFHGSSEHDMHLAVSVFRAVENRVPLARAVNTGVSAVIDGNGLIVESLRKLRQGLVVRSIPLDDRVSAYTRWGDWVGLGCLAISIGLAPLYGIRAARQAHSA